MARPGKRERERNRQRRRADRRAQGTSGPSTTEKARPTGADPIRGTTAPFIDPALSWHLARTAPLLGPLGRKHLDEALRKGEVAAFRPRASEIVVRRGRRVVKRVPLLIRTVIIGVRDRAHLDTVARLPGVAEIVSYPAEAITAHRGNIPNPMVNVPAELDPEALQAFMIALAASEVVKPTGVGVGDQVIIRDGSFASFPGVVEQILPNDRINVGVAIFGRTSLIELGIVEVQRI